MHVNLLLLGIAVVLIVLWWYNNRRLDRAIADMSKLAYHPDLLKPENLNVRKETIQFLKKLQRKSNYTALMGLAGALLLFLSVS